MPTCRTRWADSKNIPSRQTTTVQYNPERRVDVTGPTELADGRIQDHQERSISVARKDGSQTEVDEMLVWRCLPAITGLARKHYRASVG